MPNPSWSFAAALSAAAVLSACATAPAPGPVARDETGVVVAARPIVIAQVQAPDPATPLSAAPIPATAARVQPGPVPTAGPAALPLPEPMVRIAVIADAVRAGETQLGVSYTIRRDRDGTLAEVGQTGTQALAPGTRVHIGYDGRVRITPLS
jgi:hypothetical protein